MPPTPAPLHALRVLAGQVQSPAPAFRAVHVDHAMLEGLFDPFLLIDHFEMDGPFFAPHPHAGFSVSTYLFEDSEGAFLNRDSLGDDLRIEAGGLLWAHAGGGMQHEENPAERGPRVHGLQTWVNVALAHKHAPPRREGFARDRVPTLAWPGGAEVRLLAGELAGARGPGGPPTEIRYLDARLPADAETWFDVPPGHNAFAFALSGAGAVGPADRESALAADQVAAFGRAGGRLRVRAGGGGLRVAIGSGRPLDIAVAQHGPFVGASLEDLRAYFERYRSGGMGQLTAR